MAENTTTQGAPRSLLSFLREGRAGAASRSARTTVRRARFWTMRRGLALTIALMFPVIAILGYASSAAQAADEDESMKWSFYKVASSTTSFFSAVQEPGSAEGFSQEWLATIADPGSAGSLLGYADPNFSDVKGWINSKLSGSSDAISYDSLLIRESSDASTPRAGKFQGMVDYAYFGAALKGMGLDSTSTGLGMPMMNWLSGGIVKILFGLSGAVDFVFNAFVNVLSMLNPFKLFYLGVSAVNPTLADGMIGNGSADVGPLSGVVEWIGGWYQVLTSLSWGVMVPLFIAVLLFGLLMFKKMDRGGAVKKLIIRVMFIGLGLPLLGTMYTGMITSMADASSEGNAGSSRVVMSTYVDFEGWATNSRLRIPDGATIEWDTGAQAPSGRALANVRNTALAINNQTLGAGLTPIISSGSFDASWSNTIMEGKGTDAVTPASTYAKTSDLLDRYMDATSQIPAAAFENETKGDLGQMDFKINNSDTVNSWFDTINDPAQINKVSPVSNPVVSVRTGTGLRASSSGNIRTFTSNTSNCTYTGAAIINSDGAPRACNLSPLAMYNYLNTDFGPTSMRMYSSTNVASEATRAIHNSVNLVGSGSMSFLYWLNAVVLLGSFVLIGFGYAFSMLFASIKRSIQVVTAIPFATLGAIAGIAKVLVYSIALILEVIVTIFTYKLVQEFLTSLPQIIEMPFASVLSAGKGGENAGFIAFLVGGPGFALVVTLLSIIGVVVFTVLALRLRKSFVKAVEEAVTKLVEKFMDTQVGMPGAGSLAPALAGGLASGAGAAAATKMMSGKGKGPVGTTPGAPGQGGPEGVTTTAGGVAPAGTDGQAQDGQLEITQGASGNGDPGSPDGPRPSSDPHELSITEEVNHGREVQQNGLSSRQEQGAVTAGDAPRAPQVGDDALSDASASMDETAQGYKDAKAKRAEAAQQGGKAAVVAGETVARAVAGDGKGAVEAGGRAVEHGGQAVATSEEAKATAKDAGRSSLDKPDTRHQKRADNARTVSKAGGAVAQTASVANGTSAQPSGAQPGPAQGKSTAPQKGAPQAAPGQHSATSQKAAQNGASTQRPSVAPQNRAPQGASTQRSATSQNRAPQGASTQRSATSQNRAPQGASTQRSATSPKGAPQGASPQRSATSQNRAPQGASTQRPSVSPKAVPQGTSSQRSAAPQRAGQRQPSAPATTQARSTGAQSSIQQKSARAPQSPPPRAASAPKAPKPVQQQSPRPSTAGVTAARPSVPSSSPSNAPSVRAPRAIRAPQPGTGTSVPTTNDHSEG